MQKVIAIVGPTASGKTALSVALAKHFNAEIISADSMQIYREMNIGTAKPSMEERQGIPHHLMGHISVEDSYNVATYVKEARLILEDMKQRDILPIFCGGTGLYLDHLLNNTDFFDIPLDASVREKYELMAAEKGNSYIYDLLFKKDPILAEKLHPNDTKRVIRGLEVLDITGKRLSEMQQESRGERLFDVLYIGLNYKDRSLLYDRINRRVDLMVEQGLMDEVQKLKASFALSDTARAAIGYKELLDSMDANASLDDAIELIKQKSRNYAKRQQAWFGRNKDIHWFYRDKLCDEAILLQSSELAEHFLKGETE